MAVADIPEVCWDLDPACLTAEWDEFSAEVKARAHFLAVNSLRMLTAYRVGGCPITVRPCKPSCALPGFMRYDGFSLLGPAFTPMNYAGIWVNGCGCAGSCGCGATCEVRLPAPVGNVTEIKVDGQVQDLADFRIDNGGILVYQGSDDCPFNMAQDLSKPDTETGTWSVTYLNAYPVDAGASYAAGLLAIEFAKACSGGKCRLPSTVVDLVKQGVTMQLRPGAFPDGFTGIREVDQFISLWKPAGSPQQAPKVWSPSMTEVRRTTRSLT